jgi:hypothetical protein
VSHTVESTKKRYTSV